MNKSPQYNQQSKSEVGKYVFTKTWESGSHSSIYNTYLKINRNSGFHLHARKNPKQQHLKVVTFSDPSFSKKHIYVYNHAA